MSYWCFHDRAKRFTFTDGVLIELCADCSVFDEPRRLALRVSNVEMPKARQETHWNLLLEKAGLSMTCGDKPWLVYVGEILSDKAVYKAPHVGGFEEVNGVADIMDVLSNMKRTTPIAYSYLDDYEHDLNARYFTHTLTMPRPLRSFCPTCTDLIVDSKQKQVRVTKGVYRPIEHDCGITTYDLQGKQI